MLIHSEKVVAATTSTKGSVNLNVVCELEKLQRERLAWSESLVGAKRTYGFTDFWLTQQVAGAWTA